MIRRLLASLRATVTRGRLEPGRPHPYSPEPHWPWICWCDSPKTAPVHDDRLRWGTFGAWGERR